MKIRTFVIPAIAAAAIAGGLACSSGDTVKKNAVVQATNGSGSASAGPAAAAASKPAASPLTVTGAGEDVQTLTLPAGGYTLDYSAPDGSLIVAPVEADGSDGTSIVLGLGDYKDGKWSALTGRTVAHFDQANPTIHISNTNGAGSWTLTFTPLG